MARLVASSAAALACAAALAGCSGDEKSGGPLEEALGFFPADAAVVVAAETDPDRYRELDRILGKLPFGDRAREVLREMLERGGADYEKEVKPLLGNPVVFGVADAKAARADPRREVVAALETKDAGKAETLVEKYADEVGEKEGATVYEDDTGGFAAVKDDVVVLARNREALDRALERREGDDKLDEETFDKAFQDLPDEDQALARAYANAESLMRASPRGGQARRVKWIEALRTLGLTLTVEGDRLEGRFDLRTEPAGLTDADLPLAAGAASPRVVRRAGDLNVGIRAPNRLVEFGQSLTRAAKPERYADLQIARRQLERRFGLNVDDDLLGQLTRDVSINASPGNGFALRAELAEPERFERALAKAVRAVPALARGRGGLSVRRRGRLYTAARPDGRRVVFGVARDVFVAAGDPATARSLAAASPRPVPGAEGALVVAADAERLANSILPLLADRIGPAAALFGPLFTSPLGELSGSARADKTGVRGAFALTID